MNARVTWSRRRISFVALVVVLAALAVPVSFAVAGNGSTVTLPMLTHDNSCGTSTGKKQIGKVTFSAAQGLAHHHGRPHARGSGGLRPRDLLRRGPDQPVSCSPRGDFHKGKVGADGHLRMSYTLTGTDGYNDFAVYGFASSGTPYDDSGIAHLAGG